MSEKDVHNILEILNKLEKTDKKEKELFEGLKQSYVSLNDHEKESLFTAIVDQIEIPKNEIQPIIASLADLENDDAEWSLLFSELRRHLYSPRLQIFRKISRIPGGLKFLLDLRGDLLALQRKKKTDLTPLQSDLFFLFEQWFQDGFLYLEEITLDSSYRQIDLIKASDMVHPMTSIEEMGQRLGKDRRCFALYHRLIPYEPIIFIEVALTEGIVRDITEIIDMNAAQFEKKSADTAIFYSINNTQNGLAGLGLGQMLIGQVVDYIKKENEQIKRFATLSPVPGFWRSYLQPILDGDDTSFLLKPSDIPGFFTKKQRVKILEDIDDQPQDHSAFNRALSELLSGEQWINDEDLSKQLREPLVKISFHYIDQEKDSRNRPLNAVANFHLGNGATISIKDVNYLANTSSRGLKESCGMMVNYIYTPSWLNQVRQSLRWVNKLEMKNIFTRN